jgi:hypothetical protein
VRFAWMFVIVCGDHDREQRQGLLPIADLLPADCRGCRGDRGDVRATRAGLAAPGLGRRGCGSWPHRTSRFQCPSFRSTSSSLPGRARHAAEGRGTRCRRSISRSTTRTCSAGRHGRSASPPLTPS